MAIRVVPSRRTIQALLATAGTVLAARLLGLSVQAAGWLATAALLALAAAFLWDYRNTAAAWRRSAPRLTRRLPAAFAIGVKRPVVLRIDSDGDVRWPCIVYDHADPTLRTEALPIALTIVGGARV